MLTNLEFNDGVTRITLDDGKVNAMSFEMLTEIAGRLEEAAAQGGPVVLQGRTGSSPQASTSRPSPAARSPRSPWCGRARTSSCAS